LKSRGGDLKRLSENGGTREGKGRGNGRGRERGFIHSPPIPIFFENFSYTKIKTLR